ncbi:uncharacterized protein LOC110942586 [Helianthus annuus]|uniref:uncharacterized protein LOC110942586 n=1 Tax=Helianthus annuus TaxID=4232 RepID=UPI000B8F9BE6|nr:uncharacterized protein LOC110942586 [Helianthus annuus]
MGKERGDDREDDKGGTSPVQGTRKNDGGNMSDGVNINQVEDLDGESTPGTAPVRGIGLRVTNIEGTKISSSTDNGVESEKQKPMSFASVVQKKKDSIKVNFRKMEASEQMEGVDVVLPVSSVKEVSDRYINTLYGYFLEKRLAFPVVDYFSRNNWSKYGISKLMMNAKGFFFFKFKTKEVMDQLLEDGPWMIKNVPIILREWTPAVTVVKKDISSIPVWVKMHDIPLAAFTEDGLSLVASKIGVPKKLDSYTATTCTESWGRSNFARALIEVNAAMDLKRNVTIAVPGLNGNSYSKVDIRVEYDWEPVRCSACCIFGHHDATCPKNPVRMATKNPKEQGQDDGYTEVTRKKGNQVGVNSKNQKAQQGIQLKNQKPKMVYRPIPKHKSSGNVVSSSQVRVSNSFDILQEDGEGIRQENLTYKPSDKPETSKKGGKSNGKEVLIDAIEVEDLLKEIPRYMDRKLDGKNSEGASTPGHEVCAITETHVNASNVYKVCKKVCPMWSWASNAACCSKGTRIMVGWDANLVDVMILAQSDQVVHTQILFKVDQKTLFCSLVYADNQYKNRRDLWKNLCMHHSFMRDKPWVIMGDFNCSLFLDDTLSGSSTNSIGMADFNECVNAIEVFDINSLGLHYTWTNKQQKHRAVFKKIGRILGNTKFIDLFPAAAACFHPYRLSDHTPCILVLSNVTRDKPKPFKFVNLLAEKKEFKEEVTRIWDMDIPGVSMFQVVKKLKLLKTLMRKLLLKQGNLHENVKRLRKEMDECQCALDEDPLNNDLMNKQSELLQLYKSAVTDEALFLQQKSKVDWLALGDSSTRYFHSVVCWD